MWSLTGPGSEGCGTLHDVIQARNGHYMVWIAAHGLDFELREIGTSEERISRALLQ